MRPLALHALLALPCSSNLVRVCFVCVHGGCGYGLCAPIWPSFPLLPYSFHQQIMGCYSGYDVAEMLLMLFFVCCSESWRQSTRSSATSTWHCLHGIWIMAGTFPCICGPHELPGQLLWYISLLMFDLAQLCGDQKLDWIFVLAETLFIVPTIGHMHSSCFHRPRSLHIHLHAWLQAQLALTQEQQEAMLKARQRLLKRLAQASEQRLAAYSALGFDLASMPRVSYCKPSKPMRANLVQEALGTGLASRASCRHVRAGDAAVAPGPKPSPASVTELESVTQFSYRP